MRVEKKKMGIAGASIVADFASRCDHVRSMPFDVHLLRQCWFLAGPTAAGKTAAGLELADSLGAEIVALDSMTLYRGMDIGTAKPGPIERSRIPHHLLDVLDPHQEYSLVEYVAAAARVCREITERGRVPLFVGGAGLYLRGILRGVFEGPSADWNIRRRWEEFAAREGAESLRARLAEVDPPLADRLHFRDTRRIIRGLEVFELTGKPLSEQQQQPPLPDELRPRHVYWIEPPRDWLRRKIDQRVLEMFDRGLVAEVEHLRQCERPLSRTAQQGLGYKEVLEYLAGERSLDDTVTSIQSRTRQFAKRQHTWFRNLVECMPIDISADEPPEAVARRILDVANSRPEPPDNRSG
jgi:tRNA dimethylallyltransferase